jgi:hypothetical protein
MRIVALFLLLGLFLLIFSNIGMQMWGGQMRHRCYDLNDGFIDGARICSSGPRSKNPWNPTQGNATGMSTCEAGQAECLPLMDARFQGSHYDNIGASMAVIMQFMTSQGWAEQMARVQDAFSPLMVFFFLALLLVGPLYLMLMFQIVLIKTLAEIKQAAVNLQLRDMSAKRSNVRLCQFFSRWADILVCAGVFERNQVAKAYLVASGFHYRFRNYVQARHCFTHWHSHCASVIMGEKAVTSAKDGKVLGIAKQGRSQNDELELEFRRRKKRKTRKKASFLRKVAMSSLLETSVSCVIVVNCLCMMLDMDRKSYPGMLWKSDALFRLYLGFLEFLNTLCTLIFTSECIVKIVGMGTNAIHGDHLFWPGAPLAYFRNGFNVFDFTVVVLTGIQIPDSVRLIVCYLDKDGAVCKKTSAGMSVLRMFRLARLVRLVRNYPQVTQQVLNLIKVARPAAAQSVIIIIFIVIFSIMGKDLLGGKMIKK